MAGIEHHEDVDAAFFPNLAAHGFLEGNPVMHFVQLYLGPWWAVPKVAAHILLASVILWLPTRKLLLAAVGMVLIYAVIVGHNLLLTGWLA